MKKLTAENFKKASDYIFANATPIDMAWYNYNFVDENTDKFMDALSEYQYENGGFGGLVHEFEYQGPCLKCTEHAFRYIYYIKNKPSSSHPVIKKMMDYVLNRYRPEEGCWGDLLEPEVNDELHVWWWEYENDNHSYNNFEERIKYYNPNGQAALAAFVALYKDIVPKDLYEDIIKFPAEKIIRYYDDNSPYKGTHINDKSFADETENPYNMKCLSQFCDCLKDKNLSDKLKDLLCQNPTACMELDKTIWHEGYHETPSDVVTTPNFLYAVTKTEVDGALDYLIERQSDDGAWSLTFRFGEGEKFRTLEKRYECHLTMLYLAQLKRFDRILYK